MRALLTLRLLSACGGDGEAILMAAVQVRSEGDGEVGDRRCVTLVLENCSSALRPAIHNSLSSLATPALPAEPQL